MNVTNKNKTTYTIIMFFLAMIFSSPLFANEAAKESSNAKDLLMQMNKVQDKYDYSGVMYTTCGKKEQQFRVINDSNGHRSIYHSIEMLGDKKNKIVRENDTLSCYFPSKKTIIKDIALSDNAGLDTLTDLSGQQLAHIEPLLSYNILDKYYNFELSTVKERIANRDALVINLTPKDEYRFKQQLFLDEQTKLLLRFTLTNNDNVILRSQEYVDLSFDDINQSIVDDIDTAVNDEWKVIDHSVSNMKEKQIEKNDSNIVYLANKKCQLSSSIYGYQYKSAMTRHAMPKKDEDMPVTRQYNYSDGVSTLSIFVEPLADKKSTKIEPTFAKKDTIVSYATSHAGQYIIMLGEVPEALINSFAQELKCS